MNIENKEATVKCAKKILLFALIVLLALAIIWVIGGNKASENALNHANLSKEDVSFIRYEFDFDNFIPTYEVSWYQDSREMEYTVHAITGQLLEIDN